MTEAVVCSIGLMDRTTLMLERMMENRQPDRGPEDYDADAASLRDLIKQTVRASVEIQGGYHEGGGGAWKDKALITLGLAFIVGGILMFRELGQVETKVDSLQAQVTELKSIVTPRYRGG